MVSISSISNAFKTLLSSGPTKLSVELLDPTENAQSSNHISLWLYQVQPDEFSRNASPPILKETTNGNGVPKRKRSIVPPLGVNLYYLVTPMMGSAQSNHDALGELLLTIHQSPIFRVQSTDLGEDEEIRISLPADPLDERLHLWDSLKADYQLSFVCLLRTARLFSSKTIDETPVLSLTSSSPADVTRS